MKKRDYANLRVLPQFSVDAVNEANQRVTRHILQNYSFDPSLGLTNYSNFSEAVKNSIAATVPCLPPFRKRQPWVTLELTCLRNEYYQSRVRFLSLRSESNQMCMSQLARQMATMYTTQQEQYLNSICDNIEFLTGDCQAKLAWTAIDRLTGRKSRSNGIVTADDSIDRLKQWHAHFKTLLSPETPPVRSNLHLSKMFHNLSFCTGELTTEELDNALSALSSDKAAGVDEIVNEILRRPELSDCILEILNMCHLSRSAPNEWHISLLIPVFKKSNPSVCINYRGIALMSACAKLYNRLLLGRIRDGLDAHLRPS